MIQASSCAAVGSAGSRGRSAPQAFGVVLGQVRGHLPPEVRDQPLALGVRHRHEPAHQADPVRRVLVPHQRPQHRAPGPQLPFLPLDDVQVLGEQVVQRGLPLQHLADLLQTGTQLAQRAQEVERGDRPQVVEAVARGGHLARRDDALVTVESDGAHAQTGPVRDVADGVQGRLCGVLNGVHTSHPATSSRLRRKYPRTTGPARPPTRAHPSRRSPSPGSRPASPAPRAPARRSRSRSGHGHPSAHGAARPSRGRAPPR